MKIEEIKNFILEAISKGYNVVVFNDNITDLNKYLKEECLSLNPTASEETLKLLINSKLKSFINHENLLHIAVRKGRYEISKRLIELGADVNRVSTGHPRWTPLVFAANHDNVAIIDLLLNHGAAINQACGENERRALHTASIGGHAKAVEHLIKRGADTTLIGLGGTALSIVIDETARDESYYGLIKLFIHDGYSLSKLLRSLPTKVRYKCIEHFPAESIRAISKEAWQITSLVRSLSNGKEQQDFIDKIGFNHITSHVTEYSDFLTLVLSFPDTFEFIKQFSQALKQQQDQKKLEKIVPNYKAFYDILSQAVPSNKIVKFMKLFSSEYLHEFIFNDANKTIEVLNLIRSPQRKRDFAALNSNTRKVLKLISAANEQSKVATEEEKNTSEVSVSFKMG